MDIKNRQNRCIQYSNIELCYVKDEDNFIIKLRPKNFNDEIIIIKGLKDLKYDKIKEILNSIDPDIDLKYEIEDFRMPKINFKATRKYKNLNNSKILNKTRFSQYKYIIKMFSNTEFNMDEVGAKVESKTIIHCTPESAAAPPKIEKKHINLYLNKPFEIILKNRDSKIFYFNLKVNNDAIMKKIK